MKGLNLCVLSMSSNIPLLRYSKLLLIYQMSRWITGLLYWLLMIWPNLCVQSRCLNILLIWCFKLLLNNHVNHKLTGLHYWWLMIGQSLCAHVMFSRILLIRRPKSLLIYLRCSRKVTTNAGESLRKRLEHSVNTVQAGYHALDFLSLSTLYSLGASSNVGRIA